jgi:hypothetical protein
VRAIGKILRVTYNEDIPFDGLARLDCLEEVLSGIVGVGSRELDTLFLGQELWSK